MRACYCLTSPNYSLLFSCLAVKDDSFFIPLFIIILLRKHLWAEAQWWLSLTPFSTFFLFSWQLQCGGMKSEKEILSLSLVSFFTDFQQLWQKCVTGVDSRPKKPRETNARSRRLWDFPWKIFKKHAQKLGSWEKGRSLSPYCHSMISTMIVRRETAPMPRNRYLICWINSWGMI